ncbi:hypothetical protein MKW92_032802 [Papaver armeniacum]|nr:hypothetical protein MKW92_032802 [Papaver armeniacum]
MCILLSCVGQVVVSDELIDYYDIPGSHIPRLSTMAIWEIMQVLRKLRKMIIKGSYFSLFVSATALQKEKDHSEGFAPEVRI